MPPDPLPTTRRVLTGGEIRQVRQEAYRKAYGIPDQPPEPQSVTDMATPEQVRAQVAAETRRIKA